MIWNFPKQVFLKSPPVGIGRAHGRHKCWEMGSLNTVPKRVWWNSFPRPATEPADSICKLEWQVKSYVAKRWCIHQKRDRNWLTHHFNACSCPYVGNLCRQRRERIEDANVKEEGLKDGERGGKVNRRKGAIRSYERRVAVGAIWRRYECSEVSVCRRCRQHTCHLHEGQWSPIRWRGGSPRTHDASELGRVAVWEKCKLPTSSFLRH